MQDYFTFKDFAIALAVVATLVAAICLAEWVAPTHLVQFTE